MLIAFIIRYGLRCPPGTVRVPLRLLHKSQLRSLLVSLRETLAHAHAAKLAELPLFAPLTTNELLALCRRATEVELPPRHNLRPIIAPNLATETALVKPLAPDTLPNDAFAVVLNGDVLLVVDIRQAFEEQQWEYIGLKIRGIDRSFQDPRGLPEVSFELGEGDAHTASSAVC